MGTSSEIAPSGTLTTLYSFCSLTNCADGADPVSGLVQATNGKLYGTTTSGGNTDGGEISPRGTVFDVTCGRRYSLSGRQRRDVRDCVLWRGSRRGHGLQGRHRRTDHASQLLLAAQPRKHLPGRPVPGVRAGAGRQRELLRKNHLQRWGQRHGTHRWLRHHIRNHPGRQADHPVQLSTRFAGLVQNTNGNFYGTTATGGVNLLRQAGRHMWHCLYSVRRSGTVCENTAHFRRGGIGRQFWGRT